MSPSISQVGRDNHCPIDQQPDPQPPLSPTERPPPPCPRHVRLLPPLRHFCLHTCLTGCLTSAANQVERSRALHVTDFEITQSTEAFWYHLIPRSLIDRSPSPVSQVTVAIRVELCILAGWNDRFYHLSSNKLFTFNITNERLERGMYVAYITLFLVTFLECQLP